MPYGRNTDIQSLRAGFFGGGGDNVTALVENGGLWWIVADNRRQFLTVLNSRSYVTRRLYKTSSGATLLLFSFL